MTLVHSTPERWQLLRPPTSPHRSGLLGQTALSVVLRYRSWVGDRPTRFQDALWNKGSSKPQRLVSCVSVEWAQQMFQSHPETEVGSCRAS